MRDPELDRLVRWLQETERPETQSFLSVPSLGPDQLAFGPNIPALGAWMAEQRPSGLIVPWSHPPAVTASFAAFATADDMLGHATSWDELIEAVAESDFEPLIGKLLSLNAFLEHRGVLDPALNRELSLVCVPDAIVPTLRPLIESGQRVFTSPQVVLTLAKLVLGHSRGSQDVPLERVGPLLLGTADHVGGHVGSEDEDWPLELTRYGWFHYRDHHTLLWGRFQRLWREVIPSLAGDVRYVDPGEVIEHHVGIDYATFLALGIGLSSLIDQRVQKQEPPLWIRADIQGTTVPPAVIAEFVDSLAAERDWYVDQDERHDDESFSWNFTRMRMRPLLRCQNLLIPFSLGMLRERVTDGLFYTVADAMATKGASESQRWREFFGLAWETYIHRLIEQGVGDRARVVPEDRLRAAWPDESICDNLIEYPGRYLLIEAVARRLTEATVAKGNLVDLQDDLRKAAVVKSRQLCSTMRLLIARSDALEAELGRAVQDSETARYTPVVVLPGPFPLMPVLSNRVATLLKEDAECAELGLPRVDDVAFLTAGDFELLVGTAANTGRTLVQLLDAWRESDLRDMNWRTWASQSIAGGAYLPEWLVEGGKEGLLWGARQLFAREPPANRDMSE